MYCPCIYFPFYNDDNLWWWGEFYRLSTRSLCFLIFTLHITLEFPLRPIGNNGVHKFQFLNIGLNNLFAPVKLFFKCKGCFWLIYICNITDIFVFTSCIKCTVNYICRLILLHGIFFKDDINDNLEFQSHYKGKCTYLLNGNVN